MLPSHENNPPVTIIFLPSHNKTKMILAGIFIVQSLPFFTILRIATSTQNQQFTAFIRDAAYFLIYCINCA